MENLEFCLNGRSLAVAATTADLSGRLVAWPPQHRVFGYLSAGF
jgi:hypothetical protein